MNIRIAKTIIFLIVFSTNIFAQSGVNIDDRFFHPEVYAELNSNGFVKGKLLGHPGKTYYRAAIAKIAVEEFKDKAAELGIAERNITKAMFEGRFNPYFTDLTLAWEGLGNIDDVDPTKITSLIDNLKENGMMQESAILPERMYLHGVIAGIRNNVWNNAFGTVRGMGNVSTIADGKNLELSSKDLMLRQTMRLRGSRFKNAYPTLGRDENLTYDKAMDKLSRNPELQAALEAEIEALMKNQCAYSHFNLGSLDKRSHFNLEKDYYDLRRNRYVPSLSTKVQKKSIYNKPSPKVDPVKKTIEVQPSISKETTAIKNVEIFLNYFFETDEEITGEWSETLESDLQVALHLIQTDWFWGEGWTGATDGSYSYEFSKNLKSIIAGLDAGSEPEFESLIQAMDYLRAKEYYNDPSLVISYEEENNHQKTSAGLIATMAFLNGFFYDFGDDIFGNLSQDTIEYQSGHELLDMVFYFLGALLSPLGLLLLAFLKTKKYPMIKMFLFAFAAKICEAFISIFGELVTFGHLGKPAYFFMSTFIVAIIFGVLGTLIINKTN